MGLMDDRGCHQRSADAVVGDREGPTLDLLQLQGLSPHPRSQAVDLPGQLEQQLLIGIPEDGDDPTLLPVSTCAPALVSLAAALAQFGLESQRWRAPDSTRPRGRTRGKDGDDGRCRDIENAQEAPAWTPPAA